MDEISASYFPLGTSDIIPAARGIRLSKEVLQYYGLEEYTEIEIREPVKPESPDNIEVPDLQRPEFKAKKPILEMKLTSVSDISEAQYEKGLNTCPSNLSKGIFDFGEGKQDVNTYIIDAPDAVKISDWMLLTVGGKCPKCSGWRDNLTEIYAPNYNVGVRIRRITEKVGELTSSIPTPERDQVLGNLYRAYKLASEGKIFKNELKYLGKDGFTYVKASGSKVLNLKGQEVDYRPGSLPVDAIFKFHDWQELFAKYPLDQADIRMDDAVVSELFEDVAEGKHHWIDYYRQTPLAFLAKYCVINTTN